ncbi:NAD-dependent deacylase [Candidatus Viadribacter manganicus]|uniref:NAD-dependent protein deacylase n=1 Tax=Candidatus Viadribacter manganicus TaxID=1759059 RepID=A0A1B1AIP0_9PROT|nr:NAD-dependent deacylase [Candidatus Viadribacter manganicus]ANP46428.1 NAD-dependent deacylase [Candidatus Viadribacter manganicus]
MIAKRIFILTGAGVSAESGLSTFRDTGGIWSRYKLEEVASIQGYENNPAFVLEFYNMRRNTHAGVEPNEAHIALGQLQTIWAERGGAVTICTQNVDNLHERGGALSVIHMHGEIAKARCHDCGGLAPYDGDLSPNMGCGACGRTGGMRPHVVWFGETPLYMDEIYEALSSADLFVSIGTSGNVYPAAGFVSAARAAGIPTMEINLEPSGNAEAFDLARYGKASEQVPAWVAEMVAIAG